MLEIKNVSQSFRKGFWMNRAEILKDVSFAVPRGSIFGFLGPNGAGKTTLIHLIVGLKNPVAGTLKWDGVECHEPGARRKIGYLPERPYFYDHLTGEGLLRYFGALSGLSRKLIDDRIPGVLKSVGMLEARQKELKTYSKGMLQRIGIAQALIHNPEFLVLDEPMSGLDPIGRKEMRELILKLASEGRTIFFSTHVIPDVEAICDQVAVIQKGRLAECGPISRFMDKENLGTEVLVSGITKTKLEKIAKFSSLRETPEGFRVVVSSSDQLNDVMTGLISGQGKIISVSPIRPSLEDIFQ